MIVDLTKGPCQADVIYRNFDSAGAAALFNLAHTDTRSSTAAS